MNSDNVSVRPSFLLTEHMGANKVFLTKGAKVMGKIWVTALYDSRFRFSDGAQNKSGKV